MKKKINITYVVLQSILATCVLWFLFATIFNFQGAIYANCHYVTRQLSMCLLFSMLPYVVKLWHTESTKTLQIYYIIALAGHFIGGNIMKWYATVFYYNFILHFINSLIIGVIIYNMILRNSKSNNKMFLFLMTLACTIAVGVAWEIFEFVMDSVGGMNMQRFRNSITGEPFVGQEALWDTMRDLCLDTAGGAMSAFIASQVKIKGKQLHTYFEWKKLPISAKKIRIEDQEDELSLAEHHKK